MKKFRLLIIQVLFVCCLSISFNITSVLAQVNLTTTYTQDFNTLVTTGTSTILPAGWLLLESGTGANTTYTAGTGSGNAGDSYSFGPASNSDRALGGLQSGSVIPTIGAGFTNNSGNIINSLTISYTGEQWRLGALARADVLNFQYSTNATSLSTGTWTSVAALDFTAPQTGPTVGAIDGNNAVNRTSLTSTISSLSIPAGATFYIRWNDFNATGADDGLGVDDFSLSFTNFIPAATISCPSNIVVSAVAGTCGATVTFPDATATGAVTSVTQSCGLASGSVFPVGVSTVCFEITGMPAVNCSFTITVNDVTPPVAQCQNVTIQLNAAGNGTVTAAQVNNGSTDNCGITSMSVSPNTFTCADIFSGPSANCPMDANYIDNATNANSGPNGQTFTTLTSGFLEKIDVISFNPAQLRVRTYVSDNLIDAFTGTILATSNVANGSTNYPGFTSFTFPTPPSLVAGQQYIFEVVGSGTVYHHIPGTYAPGTAVSPSNPGFTRDIPFKTYICTPGVPVTLTVTDAAGLSSTCVAYVTVQDVTPPTAICQNATVYIDATGNATLNASQVNNGSNDVCSSVTLAVSPSTFNCTSLGASVVANGLIISEYVEGSSSNKYLEIFNGTGSSVNLANYVLRLYANGAAAPTTTNVLSGTLANGAVIVYKNSAAVAYSGTATTLSGVNWNGDDAFALFNTVTGQNVDIFGRIGNDPGTEWAGAGGYSTLDKTLRRKSTVTTGVTTNPSGTGSSAFTTLTTEWDLFAQDFVAGLGSHTFSPPPSSVPVTLTVTDASGNSSNCIANVTVLDIINPVAICQNATVILDASGNGTLLPSQIDNNSTDNCGTVSLSISQTNFNCTHVGAPVSVTLTVTDNSGNISTCVAMVTVVDITAPVAICQPVTVYLNASGNGSITAAQINNGSNDACGIQSLSVTPNTFTCANVSGAPSLATGLFFSEYVEGSSNNKYIEIFNGSGASVNLANYELRLYANGAALPTSTNVLSGTLLNGATVVYRNSSAVIYAGTSTVLTAVNWNGNDAVALFNTVTGQNVDIFGRIGDDPGTEWNGAGGYSTLNKSLRRKAIVLSGVTTNPSGTGPTAFTTLTLEWDLFNQDDVTGLGAHSLSSSSSSNTVTLTVTDINGNVSTCTTTVTVLDTIDPTASCQPVTIQLDAAGNATLNAAQVDNGSVDACGIQTMTVSPNTFTCANVGNNTVTLTVTDINGNTATCTSVVTVQDLIAPVANCQNVTLTLNAAGNATLTAAQVNNNSTDACGIQTMSVTPNNFTCANVGTGPLTANGLFISEYVEGSGNNKYLEIYNGTGASVNLAQYELRLYSNGAAAPSTTNILSGTLANGSTIVYRNSAAAVYTGTASVLSAVNWNGDDAIALFNTSTSQNVDIFGRIGDDPGTSWTGTGGYTTVDKTLRRKSTILTGVTVNPSGTGPSAFVTLTTGWDLFLNDDVSGLGAHVFTPPVNVTPVVLTVTDGNGNSSTCNAYVTVIDNIVPVVTPAVSFAVTCDGSGNLTELNAWLLSNGGATATDACGVTWSNNFTALSDLCGATGAATVTFTAADPSGNSASTTATFTITDNVAPTVSSASSQTVQCDGSGNTAALNAWLTSNGGATASDVCSGVTWSNNFVSLSDLCGNTGSATVIFTATDACGNASSTTATFTIIDTTNPSIGVAASGQTVQCDGTGNTAALNAWLTSNGGATASDVCSGVTWSNNFVSLSDLCGNTGSATVIFTATDACGNASSTTATFTIIDTTNPSIGVAASGQTVQCDGTGNTAALNAWLSSNGGATASDVCSGVSWSNNFVSLSDLCGNTGSATVIFTATDACGNASSTTATFTIIDTTNPSIGVVASGQTVQCDGTGNTAALNAWLSSNGGATASDVCSGVSWSNDFVSLSDLCGNTGSATVIFIATDACGNASSTSAAFTIEDTTVPVINCPADISVNNDLNSCGAIVNFSVTASDICSGSATIVYSIAPGSYFNIGTTPVNVTATDGCGNISSCSFNVTVVDNQLPVISCSGNISMNTSANNCGSIVNYAAPVASDNCLFSVSQTNGLTSGAQFPVGTTTNTFVVTDASGNTATCSFDVIISDIQNPVVTNCPASFSSCNPISWTPPAFTDNCPGMQVVSSHTPGTNFPAGTTTVTYTATDAYNNVSVCSFNVTRLEESVAPTSITSNRDFNNICSGDNITLTIIGGTLGQGASWRWYTGSCGGTALPAFNGMSSITVSPTVSTTYFARAEGQCNITACVSIAVTVSIAAPSGTTITSMPAFGAVGVTGVITVAPVPGATFYRWTSNLGHINSIWFNGSVGPVETAIPSVNVSFQIAQQNYQIRVVAGNACGRSNNASGHIRGTVPATTCLDGPVLACPNTTATYSVAACQIPGTNGYQWTIPSGAATITSGQGTHTVTVTFGAGFTTAQICVNGQSNFGLAGPTTCLTVSNSTAAPGAITGNAAPCESGLENYTISAVTGASSYLWTTNIAGATVSGTSTTGAVQFPSGPFSGNVCVQAVSSCGTSVATCYAVSSGSAGNPGAISGPVSGICGASNVNYALATNNANSYNWILPAGVTLVSGGSSNSVNVNFATGLSGPIVLTVEAFYNCGSATSSITVDGAPATPTVTPNTICAGTDELYFASSAGADTYSWTTTGADYEECTNGNCSQYYVIWNVGGGSLSVTASNTCGTSAPFAFSTNCRIVSGGEQLETKVYPNPTNGNLTVEFTSYAGGNYDLTITDMSGRTILNDAIKASSGMNQHQVNLESANPGMYLVYLKDNTGVISVTKITVE